MLQIDIIAAGKMRDEALRALWDDYKKRLTWSLTLHEIEGKNAAAEQEKLAAKSDPRAVLFVLDEKGKNLRSREFAAKLDGLAAEGRNHIQFIIGGADGLSDEIRARAHFLLAFGNQTWPHMLARVMLIEQIYRAQAILAGHPYHRE